MMQEIKEKPLLTAKEFSKYAGIGLGQVYQLMSRADFPVVSFNRRKYVSVRNFEKWIDAQVESRRSELLGEDGCLMMGEAMPIRSNVTQ